MNSALFEASEQTKSVPDRRLTEEQHAIDNARLSIEHGETPEDYALYEGIRQGLIGGLITPTDVNKMIIEGTISGRAAVLVSDIHDASGPNLSINPRAIAELKNEYGEDGDAYLLEQQMLRDELGINVPV